MLTIAHGMDSCDEHVTLCWFGCVWSRSRCLAWCALCTGTTLAARFMGVGGASRGWGDGLAFLETLGFRTRPRSPMLSSTTQGLATSHAIILVAAFSVCTVAKLVEYSKLTLLHHTPPACSMRSACVRVEPSRDDLNDLGKVGSRAGND